RKTFTLGSRSSQLALVQTHIVRDALQELHPDFEFKIVTMNTAGDINQSQALYLLQSKALWTTELEAALSSHQIDLIVHSLKDIPTVLEPEFVITAVLERADPHDALVMKKGLEGQYKTLDDLPEGSVVGTSSVRRVAGLRRDYPKLKFMDVVSDSNTRLTKLDSPTSPFTCLILAHAGLHRINLGHRSTSLIPPPYAVGQGALGVEV
ncbi:porphobilinogen deaminase, partial [Mrakia frigida]|uniref:porphobilinogen deaminase n=1 Tax=Mrakia frigida TaxID=29902 RepID=UPI003FCC1E11